MIERKKCHPHSSYSKQAPSLRSLLATVVTHGELSRDSLAIVDMCHITPLQVGKYATNCLSAGSSKVTLLAIVVINVSCGCLVRNTLSKREGVKPIQQVRDKRRGRGVK